MMKELMMNMPMMLVLTVGAYLLGVWVRRKSGISMLHPFLISVPVVIAILKAADIPCSFYMESNVVIDFFLGPCVVALGLLLYDHREIIKRNLIGILSAVTVGSVVGVSSVYALCCLLKMDDIFLMSLEPKSVTAPIAIEISSYLGGDLSLTAVSVVLCGFIGAVVGPVLLRLLRIQSPIAKGLAMGTSSHGLGTARAIEMGAVEGAVSGLSIALTGVMTAIIIPLFNLIVGL
jgi:predicted murein hydrolase (TIGR00659 family)